MTSNIAKAAVAWFHQHGRALPWRQTRDPYLIWISEIMLQQTQVATVIPYYFRFLERFPDVATLAAASLDEVYLYWAGLGYYRRARQLHAAAIRIVEQHASAFPDAYDAIANLPGIGRYTASAIASFAFDQSRGIVEANTQRLYARLMHLDLPIASKDAQSQLWAFADGLMPKNQPGAGEINQALMEIGSQICTPRMPQCDACPLASWCKTKSRGDQAIIPVPKPPKVFTELAEAALLVQNRRGQWLLRRCLATERWAGLWDFPRFDISNCSGQRQVLETLQLAFHERFGCMPQIDDRVHSLKHAVTRYKITLHCYSARWPMRPPKRLDTSDARWCSLDEILGTALSSSGKRVAQWLHKVH